MLDPALNPILFSLVAIAVGALVWGGVTTLRGGNRQKGVLMLVCALVLFANLLIWTV
jgi:hypothetical protein